MENDIRKLTEKRAGGYDSEEDRKKKPKRSHLEEELAKYEKSRGIKKKDVKGKKARDEERTGDGGDAPKANGEEKAESPGKEDAMQV